MFLYLNAWSGTTWHSNRNHIKIHHNLSFSLKIFSKSISAHISTSTPSALYVKNKGLCGCTDTDTLICMQIIHAISKSLKSFQLTVVAPSSQGMHPCLFYHQEIMYGYDCVALCTSVRSCVWVSACVWLYLSVGVVWFNYRGEQWLNRWL